MEETEADRGYRENITSYWLTNHFDKCLEEVVQADKPTDVVQAERQERYEKREREAEEFKEDLVRDIRQTISLAFKMPNGKTLGKCTLSEVSHYGSVFRRIACLGRPSQLVEEVVTDQDLKDQLDS